MQAPPAARVALLEIDPDLGADLSAEMAREAGRVTQLPAIDIPRGPWSPEDLRGRVATRGRVFGCVVASGLIARDVTLTDRQCTQILGPGDVVGLGELNDGSVPVTFGYNALSDARVGLLDDHFLAAAQRFPRIGARLFDAALNQLERLSIDQAISQLPRVEDRLLALFWQFADRWGKRSGEMIRVSVPLTHEALGTLIGARRPTVSLGLRDLARSDWLRREGDTWMLAVQSLERLSSTPRPRARRRAQRTDDGPLPVLGGQLADRIAALHEEVTAGMDRAARTMTANQDLRRRIDASRLARDRRT